MVYHKLFIFIVFTLLTGLIENFRNPDFAKITIQEIYFGQLASLFLFQIILNTVVSRKLRHTKLRQVPKLRQFFGPV